MDTITTNKMIDIHNHSLPLVDDGAGSYEEALKNIEYLSSIGVTDIVLTSHYIQDSKFSTNIKDRKTILDNLKSELKISDIKLYLGNEVFIASSDTILNLLSNKEISTINNSKYLLIEFPLNQRVSHIENIICELNEAGITPIIAHPERYKYIQSDFKKIYDLLEYDCLLQCNILSITGVYGHGAKSTLKRLLKEHLVSFLATDLHHVPSDNKFDKALKKINKIIDKIEYADLTYNNPKAVLDNRLVQPPIVGYIK